MIEIVSPPSRHRVHASVIVSRWSSNVPALMRAAASRGLPASEAAHAPFNEKVVAAKRVVGESQSALWNAEFELRKAGRVQRRSARRWADTQGAVLQRPRPRPRPPPIEMGIDL